jgi:hypothetical protein
MSFSFSTYSGEVANALKFATPSTGLRVFGRIMTAKRK